MTTRTAIRSALLGLGGAAILASALLHATINVPHLREDLVEIGTRPGLLRAVSLVLAFSVVAMFTFGGLVLAGAASIVRGREPARAPLALVAGTYLAFGLFAFARAGGSLHFLGYAAMGAVVAIGTARGVWRASASGQPS